MDNLTNTQLEALLNKLQSDIMNLPIKANPENFADAGSLLCYKYGHRDARHASVEAVMVFANALKGESK